MPVACILLCEPFNYYIRNTYGLLQDDTPTSYFQFSTVGRDNQSIKKLAEGGRLRKA